MAKDNKEVCRATIAVPMGLKREFRKVCINKDLKPSDVVQKMLISWIEKEKKKPGLAQVSNG